MAKDKLTPKGHEYKVNAEKYRKDLAYKLYLDDENINLYDPPEWEYLEDEMQNKYLIKADHLSGIISYS